MTNYIIESDNNIIINKEINKILKDNNLSKDNLITYNLEEKNIGDVVMDLDTVSLFGDIKVIYGYNANFLGTEKSSIEHDLEYFSKYIKNPSNNILILSVSTLDSRKKIVKEVKSCFNVISPILDPIEFIKNKLKDYKISSSNIDYIHELVKDDINKIDTELDKLMTYKINDKVINKEDIDNIIIRKSEDSIFDFIKYIIDKDKKKSLNCYNDLINLGNNVNVLIISISNRIRLLLQVKLSNGMNDLDICSNLGIKNPGQLYYLRKDCDNYSEEKLTELLHELSIMDEKVKSGKIDLNMVFPLFIANL